MHCIVVLSEQSMCNNSIKIIKFSNFPQFHSYPYFPTKENSFVRARTIISTQNRFHKLNFFPQSTQHPLLWNSARMSSGFVETSGATIAAQIRCVWWICWHITVIKRFKYTQYTHIKIEKQKTFKVSVDGVFKLCDIMFVEIDVWKANRRKSWKSKCKFLLLVFFFSF